MQKKEQIYTGIAILVVIILGVTFAIVANRPMTVDPTAEATPHVPTKIPQTPVLLTHPNQTEHDVIYNSKGFFPNPVTVKKGDIVRFINQTGGEMWLASNPHPTHTDYPGTNDTMCGTQNAQSMFDACRGYKMGDFWTFEFDQVGTWGYHNHLRPSDKAKIIVTE